MMEEEGMVIVGLLVGLNVLDANLCLKGEDLDSQVKWGLGSRWNDFFRPEIFPRICRRCQTPGRDRRGSSWGRVKKELGRRHRECSTFGDRKQLVAGTQEAPRGR